MEDHEHGEFRDIGGIVGEEFIRQGIIEMGFVESEVTYNATECLVP